MKQKKFYIILIAITIFFNMNLSIMATPYQTTLDDIIYLENGDYIITTIEELFTRSVSTKIGKKESVYYSSSGSKLWCVTLTGTFTYNGERANCESVFLETESYVNTWRFSDTDYYRFGSTAFGETTIKQYVLGIPVATYNEQLQLRCDENGNLY